MAGTFTLSIVAPEGHVLKKEVEFVLLPGAEGELGVLPNHAPMIAVLKPGVLRYNEEGSHKRVAVSGGFAEVSGNQISVLAETAEMADKIDLKRAEAAKERAQKRLFERGPGIDAARAELSLRKALARISAAEGKH